jgi:hypothetical protein
MKKRQRLLRAIERQLRRPDIAQHWRVALVLKKLQLMGYGHV